MPRNQFMNHDEGEEESEHEDLSQQHPDEDLDGVELWVSANNHYITNDHLEALRQKRMQDALNESFNPQTESSNEERVVD